MTTGYRGDESLLRIDSRGDGVRRGHRVRRSGGRNLDATVEKPPMSAAVALIDERRPVPRPGNRRGILAQLAARLCRLPTAYGGENEDGASLGCRRAQSIEEPDALAVHKDIHMAPHLPLLVHDALECAWRTSSERIEGVADSAVCPIEKHR